MNDDKTVSQRNHVGGLQVRILTRIDGAFSVDYVGAERQYVWSVRSGSEPEAKERVDGRIREAGHDCGVLGCPPWFQPDPPR
jgi:hypothetical protein